MSEVLGQETPLVERIPPTAPGMSADEAGVILREAPRYGYINLRGDPEVEGFLDAVAGEAGVRPPLDPNTIASGDGVSAFWLGPDEWYLRTEPGGAAELVPALESALADYTAGINDGSSGVATLVLEGRHARDVLEKGCTLDLHPRVFGEGQCAQTLLAKAAVVLRPVGEGFEIVVRRSLADYVYVWIADAADEFGLAVTR